MRTGDVRVTVNHERSNCVPTSRFNIKAHSNNVGTVDRLDYPRACPGDPSTQRRVATTFLWSQAERSALSAGLSHPASGSEPWLPCESDNAFASL